MAPTSRRSGLHRFFSSLRFRLMVLILLTLLPAFGLVIYSASEQRRLASTQAQESALRVARAAAGRQEQLVEAEHEFLAVLAQLPAVRDRDPSTCTVFLANLLAQHPRYTCLLIVDPAGSIVCGAGTYRADMSFADHHLFRWALDYEEFALGEYRIGSTTGKGLFAFGYPIMDGAGQVEDVLVSVLDVRALGEVAVQSLLPPGSTLTAIDRNGTILARYPDPGTWVGRSVPEAPIVEAIRSHQGEGTLETAGEDGVQRLYAFTLLPHMPDQDMFVSVGIPTAVAFADANQRLVRNLVALAIVAVLAIAVVWFGGNLVYARQLGTLLRATSRLASGDWSARAGWAKGVDELSQLARAFDSMAEALEKREVERWEDAQARARLLHQVISAQEDERKRIARELHDEMSQSLTLLIMDLDLGRMAYASDATGADGYLCKAKAKAEEMLDGLHHIVADLRPALLDDVGLGSAIASYARQRLGPLGIAQEVRDLAPGLHLPQHVATALFRIVQEALTNTVKHACATRVAVTLAYRDGNVVLTVEDNGSGFQVPAAETVGASGRGFGLLGMRERAHILGAEFRLRTAQGAGTAIEVHVPMPREEINGQDPCPHR